MDENIISRGIIPGKLPSSFVKGVWRKQYFLVGPLDAMVEYIATDEVSEN